MCMIPEFVVWSMMSFLSPCYCDGRLAIGVVFLGCVARFCLGVPNVGPKADLPWTTLEKAYLHFFIFFFNARMKACYLGGFRKDAL